MLAESKTGRSVRPLGVAAIELLRTIERAEGSDFVFPATTGESFYQGTKRIWPKVKKLSGLSDVTPHTLRHTMGSTSISAGQAQIGRAHVWTPVTNAHLVCRLLLEKKTIDDTTMYHNMTVYEKKLSIT